MWIKIVFAFFLGALFGLILTALTVANDDVGVKHGDD